jgi:hypothetical protein
MSTVARLLTQKEQLLARLEADPGPNESAEIQALLAKIETALKLLATDDSDAVGKTNSLWEAKD